MKECFVVVSTFSSSFFFFWSMARSRQFGQLWARAMQEEFSRCGPAVSGTFKTFKNPAALKTFPFLPIPEVLIGLSFVQTTVQNSKEKSVMCFFCMWQKQSIDHQSSSRLIFCQSANSFRICWLLLSFCCSLAVWTNSTPWSTTTKTQTSTWWRTWAAWTGWASPSLVSGYLPQPPPSDKRASPWAPWRLQSQVQNNSQSTKYLSLCAREGDGW